MAVAGLLILLAAQAILSMRQKSVTVDEIMYITAGYYHLKTGDFQMNMTNPPLAKVISAILLIIADPELPPLESDPADWDLIKQWHYARSFLYQNRIDADEMLFLARIPIVVLSLGLGLYVFIWGKELYGAAAGLFALFLYSFSPNILAHSRLATQDLALTAFMFISAYYFWRYVNCPKFGNLVLAGTFLGIAVITKTVALSLIPIFSAYGLIIIFKRETAFNGVWLPISGAIDDASAKWRRITAWVAILLFIGLIGIMVIIVGYGLQGTFQPIDPELQAKIIARLPAAAALLVVR